MSIAYPFLRIRDPDVIATPWERIVGGRAALLPEYIDDWDSAGELKVRRELKVNMPAVATSLGLDPEGLRLRALVTVGTGGHREDRQRRRWWAGDFTADASEREIEFTVEGHELSQRFALRTQLLFWGPVNSGGPLSPKRPGLRLWDHQFRGRVEPEESRFPIESVSFGSAFPDSREALWRLEWSPGEISDPFAGAFRLLVNEDDPLFITRLSAGDPTTIRLLMGSVRIQITRGVLANTAFTDELASESGESIAGAVRRWLTLAFPNQDLGTIRSAAVLDPARFDAALAAVSEGMADDA